MSTRSSALPGTSMVRFQYRLLARYSPSDVAFEDNLQVQWGTQDHYEIVRKVGRGKYSEVSTTLK